MSAPDANTKVYARRGETRMAALGVQPALVEEAVAAAVCGLSPERFRSECEIAGVDIGRGRRLYPLEGVKAWARRWWARRSGSNIETVRDWAETLDDAG